MMYKFRCDLKGHVSDVRCLAVVKEDLLVSGSRDRTCRLWHGNCGSIDPGVILCGHSDFIASICFVPPCEQYPDGLIVTGSNDHTICVYSPNSSNLLFRLISHTDTVCCVNPAVTGGCGLLSCSWDSNVIMWDLVTRCIMFKIPGNGQTIWSVIQMRCGTIITSGADKIIKSYSSRGEFIKSYYGHTDVVRFLCPIDDTKFLSCGNDGHVLRWNINNNSCDAAIDTVPHFLYSVCYSPKHDVIAYSGERGCIYINYRTGSEVVTVPSTSVWCVSILSNGDVAAGCSDGVIRVYTRNPYRHASDSSMKMYLAEAQKFAMAEYEEKKNEMRCPYLNDLSGPEVLYRAGKISNEIVFIRDGFRAVMYSWSTDRWLELARRRGTYQFNISKKKIHQGKAFDYLFPVNVDDSQPNLVFPLTLGEDILNKVIEFMSQHNLSSTYCETIYNHVSNAVKDDFIKASLIETSMQEYISGANIEQPVSLNTYFPQKDFIHFEKGNIDQISGKMRDLSLRFNLHVTDDIVAMLKSITDLDFKCSPLHCDMLLSFLNWPQEAVFPVIDALRLALRNKTFHNLVFSSQKTVTTVFTALIFQLQNEAFPINQLMSMKVYCNIVGFEPGRKRIIEEYYNILTSLNHMKFPTNFSTSLQVAASTLILDMIVLIDNDATMRSECLKCVEQLLDRFTDKEALYRALIAIGTLVSYEGSFFIPQHLIKKIKILGGKGILETNAQNCLRELLLCFED